MNKITKKEITDTETIKQTITQAVVETAKSVLLTINVEKGSQTINFEQNDVPEGTRHRTGPSLMQPIFHLKHKRQVIGANNHFRN